MTAESRATALIVSGFREDLCLAYANTLCWRGSPAPVEQLGDAEALLAWLAGPGGLGGPAFDKLVARARRRPAEAKRSLTRRSPLREAIYRIFSALAGDTQANDADLAMLNRALAITPDARSIGARCRQLWLAHRPSEGFGANTARADIVVGRRSHGQARRRAHPPMRQRKMSLAVHRREQGRHTGAGATWPRAAIAPRRADII